MGDPSDEGQESGPKPSYLVSCLQLLLDEELFWGSGTATVASEACPSRGYGYESRLQPWCLLS